MTSQQNQALVNAFNEHSLQPTRASSYRRSDHRPRVRPASTGLALSFGALVQHVSQDVVVAVFVHMVNSHMSVRLSVTISFNHQILTQHIPLKIVRSRISVFSLRTERTNVAWAVVH
jgi:hypothetical protein